MHIISNERGLAHWRALDQLPARATQLLQERFAREQPGLAGTLLLFTGGTYTDAEGNPAVRPEGDPGRETFDRLSLTAARLTEVMRREARRPLRPLSGDEVKALIESNLTLFTALKNAEASGQENVPEIIRSCSQPNLLTGVMLVTESETGDKDRNKVLDCYLLRVVLEALHQACGADPASIAETWDAERTLIALSAQGDPLRREALAGSDAFRAELTPELITELECWVENPELALEEDGALGLHGLYLLARWRETAAWPVFQNLFSLPGDIGYDLLGDLITEEGSILLAMVGGQRRLEIQAMIENEQLDEYCRNACLDALTCLVAWGEWPREDLITYLRSLLTGRLREVEGNAHVFAGVVSAACDLEAGELRPEIASAFQRGIVEEAFIDLEAFDEAQVGKYGSGWQMFSSLHRPIEAVADATKWLDNAPEEVVGLPESSPCFVKNGQPYIAPPKTGRNEPCPCGSGKKYKKCCGR